MCLSFTVSLTDSRLCIEMIHFTQPGLIMLHRSDSGNFGRILKYFLNGSECSCICSTKRWDCSKKAPFVQIGPLVPYLRSHMWQHGYSLGRHFISIVSLLIVEAELQEMMAVALPVEIQMPFQRPFSLRRRGRMTHLQSTQYCPEESEHQAVKTSTRKMRFRTYNGAKESGTGQ
jgi:hypothetical protein